MSLYGDYIKERLGRHIVESERGFMAYTFLDDACYITDMYISPEHRREGVCPQMADEITKIAKERDYKMLLGSVDPNTNGATESTRLLLSYGFKLGWVREPLIFFKKEI